MRPEQVASTDGSLPRVRVLSGQDPHELMSVSGLRKIRKRSRVITREEEGETTGWQAGDGAPTRDQPAWKAGCRAIAARSVYIGLTAGFIQYICKMSEPDKRCRAGFYAIRQNMSRDFADDFGKRRCEPLEAGGHAAVHIIPSLFSIGNAL